MRIALRVAALLGLTMGVAAAQPAEPVLDPKVDAILTRLEARKVNDLKAKILWEIEYDVALNPDEPEKDSRKGEIWYKEGQPVARFFVKFTEKVSGGRKVRQEEQHLFDGLWYTEVNPTTKTITRREIRKPDNPRNPFKLGDGGAFPVPFGQQKDEILSEFRVELVAPASGDPKNTDHLLLRPFIGTQLEGKYEKLDFWVQRGGAEDGLPVKVRVAKKDGNGRLDSYVTATFSDAKLDGGLSDKVFQIATPAGYEEIVERLDDPVAKSKP